MSADKHLKHPLFRSYRSPIYQGARIDPSTRPAYINRGTRVKFGNSPDVRARQIPHLPCESCNTSMHITKWDWTNDFYQCSICGQIVRILEIVPRWSEVFTYSGLTAFGDAGVSF